MQNDELERFNHIDLLYPSKYLKAVDLQGKDVTVTIEDIEPRHELAGRSGGKFVKESKPVVKMAGKDKLFVMNKTNARTVADMYGKKPIEWIGKKITLYPTTTQAGGETHECIRVREKVPSK